MTPPNLSANERLVYRVLLERAVGGVVTASLDDLGEASGLSARSITRATKTLQQHNLIRVEYRHSQHGRLTNRYHIVNAPSAQPPLELTDVLEQDATPRPNRRRSERL